MFIQQWPISIIWIFLGEFFSSSSLVKHIVFSPPADVCSRTFPPPANVCAVLGPTKQTSVLSSLFLPTQPLSHLFQTRDHQYHDVLAFVGQLCSEASKFPPLICCESINGLSAWAALLESFYWVWNWDLFSVQLNLHSDMTSAKKQIYKNLPWKSRHSIFSAWLHRRRVLSQTWVTSSLGRNISRMACMNLQLLSNVFLYGNR